jgi:hypothetical protein
MALILNQWILGKPRGSIKENPTAYQISITDNNGDLHHIYVKYKDYVSKEEAYANCLLLKMEKSDEFDVTRNKIRYIDNNTIEIKLTQDKTMLTDSKFITQIEKYPINIKTKKTKSGEKYYVFCQDKKKTFPLTDLLYNYKNIRYKNNNTLDLRSINVYECGEIEEPKIAANDDYDLENQYQYFELFKLKKYNELPKNKLILGKPLGTIFHRNGKPDIYTVCVTDGENKKHVKTINIKDYNNSHKIARKEAEKLKINMSYKLGVTKNLIKIHDDYIEVLIDNKVMKTDKIFLNLIQTIYLHKTKSMDSETYYIRTSINNIEYNFHKLITNYNSYIVDHINGDTFDNRLINLRPASYSINNFNKHIEIKGYKEVSTIFGNAIKVSTKLEKKHFSKYYSINKFGYDTAIEMAKQFRKKIMLINNFDKEYVNNLDIKEDKIILKYIIKVLDRHIHITLQAINYNKKEYLNCMKLDNKYKRQLFNYYITQQIAKYDKLIDISKIVKDKIKEIMYEHFIEHIDNKKNVKK